MNLPPDANIKVSDAPSLGETWMAVEPTEVPPGPLSLRAELKELLIPIRAAIEETQKETWQEVMERVTVLHNSLTVLANQYAEAKQHLAETAARHEKQLAATEASLALRMSKAETALEGMGNLVVAQGRRTLHGLLCRAWCWFVRIDASLWERK